MIDHGTAKSSGSISESESSYYSSSGSGSEGMSDGSSGSGPDGGGSSGGSSSSCECAWSIIAVFMADDGMTAGVFTVRNDGCGPITVTGFTMEGGPGPGTLDPALPVEIPEGGSQFFHYVAPGDIRGVSFDVHTDCGEPQRHSFP